MDNNTNCQLINVVFTFVYHIPDTQLSKTIVILIFLFKVIIIEFLADMTLWKNRSYDFRTLL